MGAVIISVAQDEYGLPAAVGPLRKVPVKKPARSVRPPAPSFGEGPRVLRAQLEDELRAQGARGNMWKIVKNSWVGRCTDCPKYENGICWANKKELFNPISPGREGVCQLRKKDGSFRRRH